MRYLPAVPLLALVAAVGFGCSDVAEPTLAPETAGAANYLSAPPELPNVERFGTSYSFNIQDRETGLMAVAGLPEDPWATWLPCGGSEPRQTFAVQSVGELRDVINRLVRADDIPLHVYDLSTFAGVCISQPVASGRGRASSIDNDRYFSGTRTNTWGYRIIGRVELASGEAAQLTAAAVFMHHPGEDSYGVVTRKVQLRPAG